MRLLLAASLILNVLLFGVELRRGLRDGPAEFARPLRTQVPPAARASDFFKRRPPPAPVPATPWDAIERRDPRQFIAGLRAIGCPEQTIRDIVATRISREFQSRLQAARDEVDRERPWWRGRQASRQWLELSQLSRALRRERDDLVEELFGESANPLVFQIVARPGGSTVGREFLPAEKKEQLREVEQHYRQSSEEVTYPAGRPLDEDERSELQNLQRQQRAEIAAILTPQELEGLDARESAAARYVLQKLPEAGSEAEFRAMVRAAQEGGITAGGARIAFSPSRYGMVGLEEQPQERREEEQRKAIQARIKELLGEQRFAQLQQAEAARQAAEEARWKAEEARKR